jgi:Mycothiol maleylpyruvate isomerase N-terminal domain
MQRRQSPQEGVRPGSTTDAREVEGLVRRSGGRVVGSRRSRCRSVVAAERAEFVGLLASSDAADWDRPTECLAWSVNGVALHVLDE